MENQLSSQTDLGKEIKVASLFTFSLTSRVYSESNPFKEKTTKIM